MRDISKAAPRPWAYYNDGFDGLIVSGLRKARPGERSVRDCGLVYEERIFGGERKEGFIVAGDPNMLLTLKAVNALQKIEKLLGTSRVALAELDSIIKARVARGEQRGGGTGTDLAWDSLREAIKEVEAVLIQFPDKNEYPKGR